MMRSTRSGKWLTRYKNCGLFGDIDIVTLYKEQKEVYSKTTFDFYRFYKPKANFNGTYASTDKEGFRQTVQYLKPEPLKEKVIIFLGGSTMWGVSVPYDINTIPSVFAKFINSTDSRVNYTVKNWGVGGYVNSQEMILLLEKIGREKIDYVIFYDWVNEGTMGYREYIENETPAFLQPAIDAGIEAMINFLSKRRRYSKSFTRSLKELQILSFLIRKKRKPSITSVTSITSATSATSDNKESAHIRYIQERYMYNKAIIEALGKSFNFKPYFVKQPAAFTKKKLSDYEKSHHSWNNTKMVNFERKVYEFAGDGFYDISDCMDTDETIYIDDAHTTLKGNIFIVKALMSGVGTDIIKEERDEFSCSK